MIVSLIWFDIYGHFSSRRFGGVAVLVTFERDLRYGDLMMSRTIEWMIAGSYKDGTGSKNGLTPIIQEKDLLPVDRKRLQKGV